MNNKIFTNKNINKNNVINNLKNERNINSDINIKISELYNDFKLTKDEKEIFNDIINNNLKVLSVTDFDCDGTTSAIINYYGMKSLNINITTMISDRKNGYGLNVDVLKAKLEEDNYDVIITADLGITNKKEVEILKDEFNIKYVIITDHHTVQEELYPDKADIIINPKLHDSKINYYNVSGGMVIYLLMRELHKIYNIEFDIDNTMLYFGVISLIGDMMPIKDHNFLFVKTGLYLMNEGIENKQLRELFNKALYNNYYTAMDIGFGISPIINSMGRLKNQEITFKYFTEDKYNDYIDELINTNKNRKELQHKFEDIALDKINEIGISKIIENNIAILSIEDCPKGLVGLISSFITNKYGVPSIVFTYTKDGEYYGGSGRSIDKINIFNAVSIQKKLLYKFGGHAAAIGLSVHKDNYNAFCENIINLFRNSFDNIKVDIEYECSLELGDITWWFVRNLYKHLSPFGQENKAPLFKINNAKVINYKIIGSNTFFNLSNEDDLDGWSDESVNIQLLCFGYVNSDIEINDRITFIGSIIYQGSIIAEEILNISKPI